ncbi:PPOX class F420-dependent oxidoreductase [Streptomyces sp. NPDC008139]|uniref:PPOX class F420-dependent oxidoreductase n=1 Tax=Streptomyces sp. NPDC008139 TaxID=3364814 RepID=UPI0036E75AE0
MSDDSPMRAWHVFGRVYGATRPELAPFVRQKTVLLTTYRKDGGSGASPVSIAVEGDHAYIRSFETALKTRRLRNNPAAQVTPSTGRGKPTGLPVHATLRRLDGEEAAHAAQVLAAKYRTLHGFLVPLAHRLAHRRTGKTVHFEMTPTPEQPPPAEDPSRDGERG